MQSTTLRLVSLDVQMDWSGLLTIWIMLSKNHATNCNSYSYSITSIV